jgi:hypothetical protein
VKQYAVELAWDGVSTINNHFPLTTQEVVELLEIARRLNRCIDENLEARFELNSVHSRLQQGLPGNELPNPTTEHPVTRKIAALDRVFVEWVRCQQDETPEELDEASPIVVTLTSLMQE